MFSGSRQLADIIEPYRHFRVVPGADRVSIGRNWSPAV
jgi:hypothetical protein